MRHPVKSAPSTASPSCFSATSLLLSNTISQCHKYVTPICTLEMYSTESSHCGNQAIFSPQPLHDFSHPSRFPKEFTVEMFTIESPHIEITLFAFYLYMISLNHHTTSNRTAPPLTLARFSEGTDHFLKMCL